ncbi:MAG TPA: response regulator transcription factor [Chloroflexia bacterium]|nr:response regulator transcription factor [Chloroflexia bacterium]
MKVLVIDDDPTHVKMLNFLLRDEGFEVTTASSGTEALRFLTQQWIDMVILDVTLPDMLGFEICKQIRETNRVPILMLSARGTTEDRVRGLLDGADDYMSKPCEPSELIARVQALARRSQTQPSSEGRALTVSGLSLDPMRHTVTLSDGRKTDLTPTESQLLYCLMRNANKILTREVLIAHAWGDIEGRENGQVDVYIRRLRRKIEDDPSDPALISTVWGLGYKFNVRPEDR